MQALSITFELADAEDTTRLGTALAAGMRRARALIESDGMVVGLIGDLGAGKSTLVRGLLHALGVEGHVKSPTYVLLEPYSIDGLDFFHFDFYRIQDPDEFESGGFREFFGDRRVCLIEWPEKVGDHLPTPDLYLRLEILGEGRTARIEANTQTGRQWLSDWIPLAV